MPTVVSQQATAPAIAGHVAAQSVSALHVGGHLPVGGGGGGVAFLQMPLALHELPEHWMSAVQVWPSAREPSA